MRQQILDVTEDGHVTVMNDNNNNNNNITTATLEDVLRNVYLDDENKVPEALSVDSNDNNNVSNGIGLVDHDSIENNDDETFSLAANRMTYPMHPHFQSTQDQTNIHELSTIVPSLSTSFDTTTNSIPIADAADEENHLLFFQDDDDDDDEDDSDGNLPRHSFSVPAHLPSTSSLTRKANAASQTINSGSPPSTLQLPPLTMASASSIIRHRKRLLEQYVQSFRANNAATTTTMPEQGTSTATTSQKATQTQTPETSPTSTIGRNLEESGSSSAAYVFHDEPSSHDHNGNAQDETRSNIAVVETIDTPAAAVDKKENKRVNFAASADQSMHRQRRQSPQSWCVDTLSPMMVLAACTILIVAVILFGMNGVWALQLQTQQTEVAWERLAHHFLQDVPASLDELQDLQRSVLQRKSIDSIEAMFMVCRLTSTHLVFFFKNMFRRNMERLAISRQ